MLGVSKVIFDKRVFKKGDNEVILLYSLCISEWILGDIWLIIIECFHVTKFQFLSLFVLSPSSMNSSNSRLFLSCFLSFFRKPWCYPQTLQFFPHAPLVLPSLEKFLAAWVSFIIFTRILLKWWWQKGKRTQLKGGYSDGQSLWWWPIKTVN